MGAEGRGGGSAGERMRGLARGKLVAAQGVGWRVGRRVTGLGAQWDAAQG